MCTDKHWNIYSTIAWYSAIRTFPRTLFFIEYAFDNTGDLKQNKICVLNIRQMHCQSCVNHIVRKFTYWFSLYNTREVRLRRLMELYISILIGRVIVHFRHCLILVIIIISRTQKKRYVRFGYIMRMKLRFHRHYTERWTNNNCIHVMRNVENRALYTKTEI